MLLHGQAYSRTCTSRLRCSEHTQMRLIQTPCIPPPPTPSTSSRTFTPLSPPPHHVGLRKSMPAAWQPCAEQQSVWPAGFNPTACIATVMHAVAGMVHHLTQLSVQPVARCSRC